MTASIELIKTRKKICNSCENLIVILEEKTCNLCACPIEFRAKSDLGCPINKWEGM